MGVISDTQIKPNGGWRSWQVVDALDQVKDTRRFLILREELSSLSATCPIRDVLRSHPTFFSCFFLFHFWPTLPGLEQTVHFVSFARL